MRHAFASAHTDQLDKPFKVVKKRAQPPPREAPGSFGGRGGGYGRFGRGFGGGGSSGGASAGGNKPSGASAASGGGGVAGKNVNASKQGGEEGDDGVDEADEPDEGPSTQQQGGAAGGDAPTSRLYGEWQTDPFRPVAEGGKVPKNSRGNVECPPFAAELPLGTVHLQFQGLGPICRCAGYEMPALFQLCNELI